MTAPGQRAGLVLSAEAFRRHVFCALLTEALASTEFALPPPCGTTSDGLLRVAQDRFVAGAIVFEFRAGADGTGWSARASISATLSIELANGELVPRVQPRPAEVDLDIHTWVEVVGAIFAAPLLIAAEAAVAAAERIFKRLIDQAVGEAVKGVAQQIQATLNAAVRSVESGSVGLTCEGRQASRADSPTCGLPEVASSGGRALPAGPICAVIGTERGTDACVPPLADGFP